jgi:hypothetical protein
VNSDAAKLALSLAHSIQKDIDRNWLPPVEILPPGKEAVVPSILFKNANRSYLTKVAHQINTTYEHACFDACAVMVRRLLESLIIETFEANGLTHEIKGLDDNFLYLSQLIAKVEAHTDWHLSRNAKNALKKFKNVGDVSAHNRRYVATRHDIQELIVDIRVVVQELLTIANLR